MAPVGGGHSHTGSSCGSKEGLVGVTMTRKVPFHRLFVVQLPRCLLQLHNPWSGASASGEGGFSIGLCLLNY